MPTQYQHYDTSHIWWVVVVVHGRRAAGWAGRAWDGGIVVGGCGGVGCGRPADRGDTSLPKIPQIFAIFTTTHLRFFANPCYNNLYQPEGSSCRRPSKVDGCSKRVGTSPGWARTSVQYSWLRLGQLGPQTGIIGLRLHRRLRQSSARLCYYLFVADSDIGCSKRFEVGVFI